MNDNQNHRVREGWTSSRVMAPPGGSGSLMLGMAPPPASKPAPVQEPAPAKENNKVPVETEESLASQKVAASSVQGEVFTPVSTPPSSTTHSTTSTVLPGMEVPALPVSANAFASGANMNGPQVLTGRPTSRVRHPGGVGGPDSGWKLG